MSGLPYTGYDSREAAMNIRVERKDGAVITIDVADSLVGQNMQHVFTPEGYYDHSEARPTPPPSTEEHPLSVGPSEGAACVP